MSPEVQILVFNLCIPTVTSVALTRLYNYSGHESTKIRTAQIIIKTKLPCLYENIQIIKQFVASETKFPSHFTDFEQGFRNSLICYTKHAYFTLILNKMLFPLTVATTLKLVKNYSAIFFHVFPTFFWKFGNVFEQSPVLYSCSRSKT